MDALYIGGEFTGGVTTTLLDLGVIVIGDPVTQPADNDPASPNADEDPAPTWGGAAAAFVPRVVMI